MAWLRSAYEGLAGQEYALPLNDALQPFAHELTGSMNNTSTPRPGPEDESEVSAGHLHTLRTQAQLETVNLGSP